MLLYIQQATMPTTPPITICIKGKTKGAQSYHSLDWFSQLEIISACPTWLERESNQGKGIKWAKFSLLTAWLQPSNQKPWPHTVIDNRWQGNRQQGYMVSRNGKRVNVCKANWWSVRLNRLWWKIFILLNNTLQHHCYTAILFTSKCLK